jgi:ankyrin repeat protein
MTLKKKLAAVIKKYQGHPEFLGIDIVDPNEPGAVDDTLLHLTARTGDLKGIEVLIASGAEVNSIGDLGNTPLHQAAMMGKVDSVRKLLQLGADPSLRNKFDQTAEEVAKLGGHHEIAEILKEVHSAQRSPEKEKKSRAAEQRVVKKVK